MSVLASLLYFHEYVLTSKNLQCLRMNESPLGLVKLRMNQANIYHISNDCNVHAKVSI